MPKTVQLRTYDLKPELLDEFLEWWPNRLVPAREANGFAIEFGYVDREEATFTWAVSVDGDAERFAEVEEAYMHSAERAAAFDGVPTWTLRSEVGLVDVVG